MSEASGTERAITGAILTRGRIYTAGDEADLAQVLPQADIDRHIASGQLTGDWSHAAAASGEPTGSGNGADSGAGNDADHKPAKRAATARRK